MAWPGSWSGSAAGGSPSYRLFSSPAVDRYWPRSAQLGRPVFRNIGRLQGTRWKCRAWLATTWRGAAWSVVRDWPRAEETRFPFAMASPVSSVEMTRETSTYPYPKIQTALFRSRRAHAVFTLEAHSGQGMSPSHQTRPSMPIARRSRPSPFSWDEARISTESPCMASGGGYRTGVAPTYTHAICPRMPSHAATYRLPHSYSLPPTAGLFRNRPTPGPSPASLLGPREHDVGV